MKDFLTLCNDIVSYRNGQRKDASYQDEETCAARKLFQGRPKSVFLLMMTGVIGIAVGCLVLLVNPYDLLFKLKVILSDGGEIFELWREPPVELYLRVYLFNITNRDAFLEGRERLRVQEVGPYTYREHLEHGNISFNENGTMTSVPLHPLKWMPELSNGTEEDLLILPNIALLSFASIMMDKSYFSRMGVNLLVRQTDTHPLVQMTAREFMFGYKSALVTLGNKLVPNWISFDKLGLIDRMYNFDGDVSTIYTGETNIAKAGLVATYNRSPKLPQWDYPCGDIADSSDGTKFPSFIQPNDTLRFFRKSLCRSVQLVRIGNDTSKYGLRAYRYGFMENALDNGEFIKDNKCFCRKGRCYPRGLVDVTDCYYGFPIALSFPHFYKTDLGMTNMVEGLHPDPVKHGSYFLVQPESGLPLEVAVRMQINMALDDVSGTTRCAPFKDMVLPLLWTEIGMFNLPDSLAARFAMYINTLPLVQDISIYLLFLGGFSFVLVAFIKLLRKIPDQVHHVQKAESPFITSKDVLSEFIDESRQIIFGKKNPIKPKSNVYKETVRQKTKLNLFGFLQNEKTQKTKEEIYEVKKSQASEPLRFSSSESEDEKPREHFRDVEETLERILEPPDEIKEEN